MAEERTFIAVKPDGVERGLVGEVLRRFEAKGYQLVALKMVRPTEELAATHYAEHKGKPFYAGLLSFITSGPVVVMVWQGKGVVAGARKLIGATKPSESAPGTIRGDYGIDVGRNIIHGSDAVETAKREIAIWFRKEEIVGWSPTMTKWIYE